MDKMTKMKIPTKKSHYAERKNEKKTDSKKLVFTIFAKRSKYAHWHSASAGAGVLEIGALSGDYYIIIITLP